MKATTFKILAASLLLFTNQFSHAESQPTKAMVTYNIAACTTEEYLDQFLFFMQRDNWKMIETLIQLGQCIPIVGGDYVQLIENRSPMAKIQYKGSTLYTISDAIKLK